MQMDCKKLLEEMTLEEKASLCSGLTFWKTKPVKRLGVKEIFMSDGPYGIRKQSEEDSYLDFHTSKSYICFPTAAGMAASFDRQLWHEMGAALGRECMAERVGVLLGPAVNIKRSPLGGRNFEYLSEDPYVTGILAAEYVKGMQEQGTSACVKHFAVNNQETRRMSVSANVDERALFEIYLPAFERIVKEASPDLIMCSYNRINHVFAAENKWLLTELLREKWGFEGVVVTDWGAVCDRVTGLAAGVDLEMPASGGGSDREIAEAVEKGALEETVLDEAALRILELSRKHECKQTVRIDYGEEHKLAQKIAAESMVLLKNQRNLLPLPTKGVTVALIGAFAEQPRYEGGGSSHINSWKVDAPISAAEDFPAVTFLYAKGYDANGQDKKGQDEVLVEEAVKAAKNADYAVVFAGLPESYESESYDRRHLKLPSEQNRLIRLISEAQPDTVVVLQNGSPVTMPWIDRVPAVLEAYLGGEACGKAIMDTLFGKVNPCGHLAETFPLRIEDTPCYLDFPGRYDETDYREGVFVGYRYYLSKKKQVLFPFGFGLSYTEFEFRDLEVFVPDFPEAEGKTEFCAAVTVRNTGTRAGKALIQLYVEPDAAAAPVLRPLRELKGFEKAALLPGEEKRVNITMDKRAFAFYDVTIHDWYTAPGTYKIQIGSDCETILCEKRIYVEPVQIKKIKIDRNTLIGDLLESSGTKEVMEEELPSLLETMGVGGVRDESGKLQKERIPAFVRELPLRSLISFTDGVFSKEQLAELLERLKKTQMRDDERR